MEKKTFKEGENKKAILARAPHTKLWTLTSLLGGQLLAT